MPAMLDADRIRRSLSISVQNALERLEVLPEVPSTNTWLMEQRHNEPGRFRAVLTEHQTAGRGQRNRRWFSPSGAGLCLSLAYTFRKSPSNLSCLTLAAGVAIANTLRDFGVQGIRLKWPNDIYAGNAKLGGILTDAQTAPAGRITMICGVGINVDLSGADREEASREGIEALDYSVTDLNRHLETLPDRNMIAARVIDALAVATSQFEALGLEPFRDDWNELDWLRGEQVMVEMPDGELGGVADGIDANGALRVMTEHGRRRVYTGTVRRTRREAS